MESVPRKRVPHACTRCGVAGHNARNCNGTPLTAEQSAERKRQLRRATEERCAKPLRQFLVEIGYSVRPMPLP